MNAYWSGAWEALAWTYNATKGLYARHRLGAGGLWDFGQVKNVHFTMAKPWDLKNPLNKGYENLNELWWAAFSEPMTLCRLLLKLHKQEKQRRAEAARAHDAEIEAIHVAGT